MCEKPGHFARDCPDFKSVGMVADENFEQEYFEEGTWDEDYGWYDDPWIGAYDFEWNEEGWTDFDD